MHRDELDGLEEGDLLVVFDDATYPPVIYLGLDGSRLWARYSVITPKGVIFHLNCDVMLQRMCRIAARKDAEG